MDVVRKVTCLGIAPAVAAEAVEDVVGNATAAEKRVTYPETAPRMMVAVENCDMVVRCSRYAESSSTEHSGNDWPDRPITLCSFLLFSY